MKKVVSLLAVLFLFAGLSFASTNYPSSFKGIADFRNSGTVDFSFTVKNVSDDVVVSPIKVSWEKSIADENTLKAMMADDVTWVRADQYAVVAATVTKAGFNVYMYQTNTEDSEYKASVDKARTNADGSKVCSGLVNADLQTGANGVTGDNRGYIPVAYSMVGTKNKNIEFVFDGDQHKEETSGARADRFFKDRADSDWPTENGKKVDYYSYTKIASIIGPVYGVDATNGDWNGKKKDKDGKGGDLIDNTAYMYFFGGFSKVNAGGVAEVYGTNQIHITVIGE